MRRTLNRIFNTSQYRGLLDIERANVIYYVICLMVILYTIYTLISRDALTGELPWAKATHDPLEAFSLFVFYIGAVVGFTSNYMGKIKIASICPLAMYFAATILLGLRSGFHDFDDGASLPIFVMLGVLLLNERGLITVPIALFTLTLGIVLRTNLPVVPDTATSITDFINAALSILGVGALAYAFLRLIALSRAEGESGSRADRLRLADITTQVAQRISRRMALADVLASAVEQVRANYSEIYHAQIFLVDERGESALLSASTGEVGRRLMERHHSLEVGSQSVIGQVTSQAKPVVARADSSDSIHRRNELLPETRVEAAFPLRIGDTVIGALDLQSKIPSFFQDSDLPIFQSLADHIAIAIDNARLFDETETRLHENQKLVEQSRQAIREVERLNQRLTGRFWDDFLSEQHTSETSISIKFDNETAAQEAQWTPALQEAIRANHPVHRSDTDTQVIALPLRVRGQVIGAMEFELDSSGNLSPEDMNLLEEVGEQLGLAAETSRLFQGSQRLAHREALVNEIATRLQTSNNVESALTEAARSLRDALRAQKVAIRLGPPPSSEPHKNGSNGDAA